MSLTSLQSIANRQSIACVAMFLLGLLAGSYFSRPTLIGAQTAAERERRQREVREAWRPAHERAIEAEVRRAREDQEYYRRLRQARLQSVEQDKAAGRTSVFAIQRVEVGSTEALLPASDVFAISCVPGARGAECHVLTK